MDIKKLDWSLVQVFLAVGELGSLSAAARKLGQSQPTVGRQIKNIESVLAMTLFDRQPRGLVLNKTGQSLLAYAQKMREAAAQISLIAAGQSEALHGVVRITASVFFAQYYLPEIIAEIRQKEPQIEIELAPSDTTENLLFREADIAIRMYRPTQLDIIAKNLGAFKMGLFASHGYLDKFGMPQSKADLAQHDFVGFDTNNAIIEGMRALGIQADRHSFMVRCDLQSTYWELVRAGCGIGASQLAHALEQPDIVQVLPDVSIPDLPVWLVAQKALKNTARIRRVYDLLSNSISKLTDA